MSTVATDSTTAAAPPRRERAGPLDHWLLLTVGALCAGGLLMILSASADMADRSFGDSFRFVNRQIMGMGLGLIGGVGALVVPWRWYRRFASASLFVTVALLALVVSPLGHSVNGAQRWLDLGVINIQPSEFAKVAMILYCAHFLAREAPRLNTSLTPYKTLFLAVAAPVGLVLAQPDFGSTLLIVALVGYMLWVAGLNWRYVAGLGGLAVAALGGVAVLEPYRVRRLTSFVDPLENASGDGYQVVQAWMALAQGGPAGGGLGGGLAKRGYLPEAHTDFIGAVVGEETGAIGWLFMTAVYMLLIWRGSVIASRASGMYGTLLAGGVTTLLAMQTVINLGVIVGWVPPKGLVLPFMSYGASAVVVHLLCAAILLRVGLESPPRRNR